MANYYVSSVLYAALTPWAASAAVTVGMIRRQLATPTVGNERVFRCTTAGTTGGTEPAWTLTNNATTADGTAVWTQVAGQTAYGWGAAAARITSIVATLNPTYEDTIFVDNTHVETRATVTTFTLNGWQAISVNAAGSVPPVKADYLRGAKVTVTAAVDIQINGGNYAGFDFVAGAAGATLSSITFGGSDVYTRLDDCLLHINNTSNNSAISITATLARSVELANNTKIKCGGGTNHNFSLGTGVLYWHDCDASDAVSSNGAMPTTLFRGTGNSIPAMVHVKNVDLTGFTGTSLVDTPLGHTFLFEDCLVTDAVQLIGGVEATIMGSVTPQITFINCQRASDTRTLMLEAQDVQKDYLLSTFIARVAGGENEFTPYSHFVTATGVNGFSSAAKMPRVNRYNGALTGTLTVKCYGVFFGALPQKRDCFLEVMYPKATNGSYSKVTLSRSGPYDTDLIDTNTEDWTRTAPTRANSTAYVAGGVIKVASNPGKIFYATTGGTSAASEPAGFATASYGDVINDGTIVWACGRPVEFVATVNATRHGMVKTQMRVRANGNVVNRLAICPKLSVS